MTTHGYTQQYVVFDPELLFREQVRHALTAEPLNKALWPLLEASRMPISPSDYEIESIPVVKFLPGNHDIPDPPFVPQETFNVRFPDPDAADRFRKAVVASIRLGNSPLKSVGVNPTVTVGEFSVPGSPDDALFGTFDDALRLIRADMLPTSLDGECVNVALIDAGVDKTSILPPGKFGGGWYPTSPVTGSPTTALPGMTVGADALHGTMLVNNILGIARKVRIFDVPIIHPPKIYDISSYINVVDAAYRQILKDIQWFQNLGFFTGPWIFVNAWAIYDRRSEGAYLGEYTENLGAGGLSPPHPFIDTITQVAQRNFDTVFCAGNCGEVCPDGRCGPNDYGPGRGIWGANAHSQVLTTGAVRVDGIWPGYSSEGPGPTPHLYAQKPDLCTPSQFVGRLGVYPPSTGSSASAAVAAGVLCALRSPAGWNQQRVPPFILKLILNSTAAQTQGTGWNRWIGNGIMDAFAAHQQLVASFP